MIDPAKTEASAMLVHADSVVDRVGWDHVLRERGADLSVGEGQLLTFARAMAHDLSVVILDEATASIDSLTEQLIQDALARIFERKTVIVIAHRLSPVERANRIVVLDRGRVVEPGTHNELLAAEGAYALLVRAGEELLVA
jgi:ATP-binding cassette subfamily B protein